MAEVVYTGSEQLTRTRYFKRDTDQTPFFDGLVPVAYKTDRAKGMRWLELKAAADAEREAAEAEAKAKALNPPETPDPLPLIADLEKQLLETQTAVLSLERNQTDLRLATPEAVIAGSAQIARVSGLASDIEARTFAHTQQTDEMVRRVSERHAELEGKVDEIALQVGELLADVRGQAATMLAESSRKLAEAISKRVTALQIEASRLRGPKGNTGASGSSIAVLPGDPRKQSPEVLEARFRRPVIAGDLGLEQAREGLVVWIYNGEAWEQAALIPVDVRVESRPLVISDQSTKVVAPLAAAPTVSSFGGGSGERPLIRTANSRTPYTVSSADHWQFALRDAGINDEICACHLTLVLTAVDGVGLAGESLYMMSGFVYRKSDNSFEHSPYSEMGGLFGKIDPVFDFKRHTASPGPGYSGGALTGVQTMELTINVNPLTSGVTQFLVGGSISWLIPEQAQPLVAGLPGFKAAWPVN